MSSSDSSSTPTVITSSSSKISYTVKAVITSETHAEIFSLKFSPDETMLVTGCGDGCLRVFSAVNNRLAYTWNTAGKSEIKLPVTSLCFRPEVGSKNKNIAICAANGGQVQHWHLTSGKLLHTITEPENQVYALDYRSDALYFATAGRDASIRIYDEATKSLSSKLSGGNNIQTAGHANRIFTVKFHPTDPNLLISGGWDNTVQIWDKRVDTAVRRIYGPHICGDGLDIDEKNVVLTGSWRPKNQLQLWDFSNGKLIQQIKLPSASSSTLSKQKCNLYTAQFNHSAQLICCGGSGNNEGIILERSSGKICGAVSSLERAIYTASFSTSSALCAAAGGDGAVYLFSTKNKQMLE